MKGPALFLYLVLEFTILQNKQAMREEQLRTAGQSTVEISGNEGMSVLSDMNHLNRILREKTQENLFLGTRNFD